MLKIDVGLPGLGLSKDFWLEFSATGAPGIARGSTAAMWRLRHFSNATPGRVCNAL